MRTPTRHAVLLIAAAFAVPAWAQGTPNPAAMPQATETPAPSRAETSAAPGKPSSSTDAPATAPAGAAAPSGAAPGGPALPGVKATTNNPNLAVSSVKLEQGTRLSKLIGADVYGDGGQQLGKVDDLVMSDGDHVSLAVISVGGILGLGSKLVAFPFAQLKRDGDRMTLPGVTSDALNGAPSFEY